MIKKQHKTCENHSVSIDWYFVNADGLPALVCDTCTATKGKRKGKPKFLSWLNTRDVFKIQYGADWEQKYCEYYTLLLKKESQRLGEQQISEYGNYNAYFE